MSLILSTGARATESPPVPAPLPAFAALPALHHLSLSPNGERLAAIMNQDGKSILVTAKWDGSDMRGIMETDNKKFVFNWIRWVNGSRLIASMRFPSFTRGQLMHETRALALDADGGNLVNLVPPSREHTTEDIAWDQDNIIDWMREDGQHVLMTIVDDFVLMAPGIYSVDVNTGKRTLVQGPRRYMWRWLTDRQHRVRVGIRRDPKTDVVEIVGRAPDSTEWTTWWSFPMFSREEVYPVAFGADPQSLYVTALKGEWRALYLAHLDKRDANGRPTLELISSDDHEDVSGAWTSSSGELIGFGKLHAGDAQRNFLDESLKELARGLDQALPNRYNGITTFSADRNRYILISSGNGQPGKVFVGDRKAGSLKLVAEQYPELKVEQMVGKRPIKFKARDGLEIKGYLTVPHGDTPASGWPMVLLPHGGPISSDDDDFDTWTELLASRGYATLQVNYRGSSDLGQDYRDAGLRRWGFEMQDDLTDGVQWAIDRQVANPRRICVVGASYGGYAALMGVVKTPDLYQCAASFAGVSDLIALSREASWGNNVSSTDKQVGNYWRDRDQLKATSPSERAKEIKVPVLLVHGTADTVVSYSQSETMAKALKSAGKNYTLLTQQGGDHHFSRQADHLQFLDAMMRFLDQNIGPSSPAATVK